MCSIVEALIVLSIILVTVEFILFTGGILAFSSLISFLLALLLIFFLNLNIPHLFLKIAIPTFITLFIFSAITIVLAYKAHKNKPLIPDKPMIGKKGVCITPIEKGKYGQVEIEGEIWEATANENIKENEKVEVIEQNSLKLKVKKEV